jgi:GH24 family phage-related lysozyme (muramidase)
MKKTITFFLFFCFVLKVSAFDYFSKYEYTLLVGQSVFLSHHSVPEREKVICGDQNIVSVGSNLIVTAKKEGETWVKIGNEKCKIKVLPREDIKFLFSDPNFCTVSSEIKVLAITYEDVKNVKFLIDEAEFVATECSKDGNTLVWSCNIGTLPSGSYNLEAESFIDGKWRKNEAKYEIFVSDITCISDLSISQRRASDDCISFIMKREGFRSGVYMDFSGKPTIGYGILLRHGNPFYDYITELEAFAQVKKYINSALCVTKLNDFLEKNNIFARQNQFDALLSFEYNVGAGWIDSDCELRRIILNTQEGKSFETKVKIDGGYLNLREKPMGKIIGKLFHNEIVNVKMKNDGWCLVSTSKGDSGWCKSEFISTIEKYNGNLDKIDKKKFIEEFSCYHHSNLTCVKGLLLRRFYELDMFFDADYHIANITGSADYLLKLCKYPIPQCIEI